MMTKKTLFELLLALTFACGHLRPVSVQQFDSLTVAVAVTYPDGSAAAEVTVELLRNGVVLTSGSTDETGELRLRVTTGAGTYVIRAVAPGFRVVEQPIQIDLAASQRVSIRLSDPPPLTAEPPPPPPPPPPPSVPTEPPSVAPDQNTKIVQVFYATDRARANGAGEFQNARAAVGSLTLGRVDVSIPPKHRLGNLERPSWWTIRRSNPDEFFQIVNRTTDSYEAFYRYMAARVGSSPDRDAFVFIHGYNVSFDDAVFRAAQIAHDLTFNGAPVVYSWPSRASLIGYPQDYTAAQQTVQQLKYFLLDIANRSGAGTIHLIGHSMGNFPLTRAVTELAGRPELRAFRHVILTAPDIDAIVFRDQIAPALAMAGPRVTLYASSGDSALRASKAFNGARRAGDSTEPLVVDGVDTIDASNVVTDFLGHSPFVPSVLMDIYSLMRQGFPPDQRFGMSPVPVGALRYWIFRPVAR